MSNVILQKYFILLLIFVVSIVDVKAQTPVNCLEIESILVDACGTPEGENEMVRFRIGSSNINVFNLNVNWPNNSFLGISPVNATTTNIVNSLNATIISCGYLIQPSGGILPAGKSVLLISSTNISVTSNSFANLTDTLYVIFQNAGNTSGHFANYSATPGLRTLVISRTSPSCSDAVMYDRSLLRNQSGGFGGTSAQNDGATVQFSWSGTSNYINNGCQAPIEIVTSDAGNNTVMCSSGTVNLNGTATGNYTGVIWMGGQGSFSSPTTLNTSYTSSPSETGSITLSLGVIGPCNDTIFSSVILTISSLPPVAITASGSTTFCQGSTVTLTASGGTAYSWSTGSSASSITVSTGGTYTVTAITSCGSQTATQSVTVNPLPNPVISASGSTSICSGDSVALIASGTGSYSWSTGSTNSSIMVSAAGTYTLTATNACGSQQAIQNISIEPLPVAIINQGGTVSICEGDNLTLNANGSYNYNWSNSTNGNSTIVNSEGTYWLIASNACGIDSASIYVNVDTVEASFAMDTPGGLAPLPVTFTNNSSFSAISYLWNFGDNSSSTDNSPSHTYQTGGNYSVTLTVTDASGCADTYSNVVTVLNYPSFLRIPNVFTPNGDGQNDDFQAIGLEIKEFNCKIYNRWGILVYELTQFKERWDGRTTAGILSENGTYFYIVKARGTDDKEYEQTGYLQLIRD